ncbi:MAG: adenylosuccinate synthetase [Byssovorax sp.]
MSAGRAILGVGLGFGDEGKGSVVDALTRRHGATLVVRFNGGPQAAHHVVSPDGLLHCFSQFGAGTLVPGVRTHLARFMAVDPLALAREEEALRAVGVDDGFARLSVDPRCVVVTPVHRALNRIRELARGDARHGSVGVGVGEAVLDAERAAVPAVRVGDARDPARLGAKLRLLWRMKIDLAEQLAFGARGAPIDHAALDRELGALRRVEPIEALASALDHLVHRSGVALADDLALDERATTIFEGAQGVLLDRDHGFFPYVTPSHTTFAHAHTLLAEARFRGAVTRVGVVRAYATRHGQGPFVTEDAALTAATPDLHNVLHAFQGAFRVGWLDAVALRHALRVAGPVDWLAVTNLDRLAGLDRVRVCTAHDPGDGGEIQGDLPRAEGPMELDERASLTARLSRSGPVYTELPGWRSESDPAAQAFLRFLETPAALGVRVGLTSWGPRAGDKSHAEESEAPGRP